MTQGLLTIMKAGVVIAKVIAGCNGYNMVKLKESIEKDGMPGSLEKLHTRALDLDVGCDDCLVVMDGVDTYHHFDDALSPDYRSTFIRPQWNPRWEHGSADHNLVVEVP